jgi:hypothetical protein
MVSLSKFEYSIELTYNSRQMSNKYEEAKQQIARNLAAHNTALAQAQAEELAKKQQEEAERQELERLKQQRWEKFIEAQPQISEILTRVNREIFSHRGNIEMWRRTRSGVHQHTDSRPDDYGTTSSYTYSHETFQVETRLIIPKVGVIGVGLPFAELNGSVPSDLCVLRVVQARESDKGTCYKPDIYPNINMDDHIEQIIEKTEDLILGIAINLASQPQN